MLNKLSDTAIRKAKHPDKKQLADGGGLYLRLRASGTKKFEFRYIRPATKKQTWLFIGDYPDVSLKEARDKAAQYREQLRSGVDPQGQGHQGGVSFSDMAEKWLDDKKHEWSESHYRTTKLRYENYIKHALGAFDVRSLNGVQIFKLLDMVARSGSYQTAEKLSHIIKGVLDRARTLGVIDINPAVGLFGQVAKTGNEGQLSHFNLNKPADKEKFARFLRDIETLNKSSPSVKFALQLAPYVFMRPANLAGLRKDQVDLANRLIEIEPSEMKSNHSTFYVPLSEQAVAIIEQALIWSAGADYVFTSRKHRGKPITTDSISKARKRLGGTNEDMTIHGLRHTATTWLSEQGYSYEATELQLHHKLGGIRGVYNKAQYLDERRRMMQAWADFISSLKS